MTDNGNGNNGKMQLKNAQATIVVDEDTKKALTKEDSLSEVNEPTKYILMDNAYVESVFDDRKKHFTQFLNKDEILVTNDIRTHARLIPIVFKSKDDKVNTRIKATAKLFLDHDSDNMDNNMSFKGFTSKLFAMMLRQDSGQIPTDKEIKKMFGR